MQALERVLSRPAAKPYRSRGVKDDKPPQLDANGHLEFSENDIENPKNWSFRRRSYITFVSVLLVVNATFASSSPSGCLTGIAEEFNVSMEASGLVITLFLLGYCAGPLIWAPLSEFYGRRWVFYGTFLGYFAFNFLCAFTPNFAGLLVGRFLSGTFASAPLSNAPGVLADLWTPVQRGNAMAIFAMMTFIGPALGPVTGGFLQLTEDWRWNFYELIWLAFVSLCLLFTIPETLGSMCLYHKARRIRKSKLPGYENVVAPVEATDRTLVGIFKVALTRPWIILFDPISLLAAVYLSVVYTLLYMLFSIYPIIFQEKRGWNSGVGELPLIGTVIGAVLGGMYVFWDSQQVRKKTEAGHKLVPEDRLPMAMLGGVLFPATMFWFAWTGEYNSIHWIVPTLAGVFLSTSILLIFVAYLNYLADTYLMYAASAIAANTVARSACGASAPLFTNYMFSALGVGGGGSLIGGVGILLMPAPFLFYKFGRRIRERSKFAPTESKEDDDQQQRKEDGSERRQSGQSTSDEDLRELDEEAGLSYERDGEKDIEKVSSSGDSPSPVNERLSADRFLDGSGVEKAEASRAQ